MSQGATSPIAIASQIVTSVITSAISKKEEKKRLEMIENFERLSNEQKIELAENLKNAEDFYAQQRLLFQYLAIEKNKELLNQTTKQKIVSFSILGIGILILGTLIFMSRKK